MFKKLERFSFLFVFFLDIIHFTVSVSLNGYFHVKTAGEGKYLHFTEKKKRVSIQAEYNILVQQGVRQQKEVNVVGNKTPCIVSCPISHP